MENIVDNEVGQQEVAGSGEGSSLGSDMAKWIRNLKESTPLGTTLEGWLRQNYELTDEDVDFILGVEVDPIALPFASTYIGLYLEKFRRKGC